MAGAAHLVSLIEQRAGTFSASQRRLARQLAGDLQSFAFSTAAEIARLCEVSEATVVRFAQELGFSGYPALQKEVRRSLRADLKGTDRLRAAEGRAAPGPLDAVIAKEQENIGALAEGFDAAALVQAAAALRAARRILVVGARATAPLAFHLWFALDKLGLPAARAMGDASEARDALGRMDQRDCAVVIGFPRYLRALVGLLDFAAARGVRRIVVTDSPFSALRGDIALHAPAESISFVAFHAAPLILLNALIAQIVAAEPAAARRALDAFEATAEAGNYFHPS